MLAFQSAHHWHDRTLHGMENDPPSKRRRLTESGRSSTASVPSHLPYGWVSEHVLAPEGVDESVTPTYPTLLAQTYWSRPQETQNIYRSDYPAPLGAPPSQYVQSATERAPGGYGDYSPQSLDWQGLSQGQGTFTSRSEPVQPQFPATSQDASRYFPNVSQPPASSTSWDVMRSGPAGPQYEYLDQFNKAVQASEGSYAPYVDAPVLRSNLPMGSRAAMPPPAQPQPNPARARQILTGFEENLESSYDSMQTDNLSVAADDLLEASTLLLENTHDLRLYQDNLDGNEPQPNWRQRRREIWRNFNTAWLGLLAKQMAFCQQERSGYPIQPPRSRISRDSLGRIGLQLRTLADMVHEKGLVDYEQGFAEDRISELFETCMELVNELDTQVTQWPSNTGNPSNPSQFFPYQQ